MASPYVLSLLHNITFKFHRLSGCHQPPVSDNLLIALIKAFNDGDVENSIHAWMCRRCSKPKKELVAVPPVSHKSNEPQKSIESQSFRTTSILGQSSDEILDPPSPECTVTASCTLPFQ